MSKPLFAVVVKNVATQTLDTYSVNATNANKAAHAVLMATVGMGYVFVTSMEVR